MSTAKCMMVDGGPEWVIEVSMKFESERGQTGMGNDSLAQGE
jgi:hypothetical protein